MNRKLSIITVGLFLVVLTGCRGNQQSKLIGEWKVVPFTNPEETYETNWVFYAGEALEVIRFVGLPNQDTIPYTYNIEGNTLGIYPPIDDPNKPYANGAPDERGEYSVDELSTSNLKITKRKHPDGSTGGAFSRVELVKK